ncbi:MAG: hypothetical protein RO257_13560 [Candidatus Kapabacteria bacterium]|nr:hypothetical protein [Candidatus Kapabacteria bacterium]
METYLISNDFKLILNKDILEKAGFNPGQEIKINLKKNFLELRLKNEKKSLKGFLKGINTDVPREHDRL